MKLLKKKTANSTLKPKVLEIPSIMNFLEPKQLKSDHLLRIGDRRDGGYVIPASVLTNMQHLLSFGLGANFSFEKQISALNPKISIKIFDHSVGIANSMKSLLKALSLQAHFASPTTVRMRLSSIYHPTVFIMKYFRFFMFSNRHHHIPLKVVFTAMNSQESPIELIMKDLPKGSLVKIDIEGSEYEILQTVIESASKIDCLIVEFHDICARQPEFLRLLHSSLEHFAIAHVHINNASNVISGIPDILEITFVGKNRVTKHSIQYSLPIPNIDFPNLIYEQDYKLNFSNVR